MKAGLSNGMFCDEGIVLHLCCLVRETLATWGYFSLKHEHCDEYFSLFNESVVQIFVFIWLKSS